MPLVFLMLVLMIGSYALLAGLVRFAQSVIVPR